jgi:hypothetical protein
MGNPNVNNVFLMLVLMNVTNALRQMLTQHPTQNGRIILVLTSIIQICLPEPGGRPRLFAGAGAAGMGATRGLFAEPFALAF